MQRILKAAAVFAALACLAMSATPVAAHHSGTMFDRAKVLTIKGLVKEVRWVNPHASITVYGTIGDDPQAEEWVFEMTSPGNLMRTGGWQRNSVQPGDKVEVTFNPLRDAETRGGSLRTLLLVATGKTYTNNLLNQEQPDLCGRERWPRGIAAELFDQTVDRLADARLLRLRLRRRDRFRLLRLARPQATSRMASPNSARLMSFRFTVGLPLTIDRILRQLSTTRSL